MKPVTGKPTNVPATVVKLPAVWVRRLPTPNVGTPPAALVAPEPVKVTIIQPFWKFCGTVTVSVLREPRTPELVPEAGVCARPLRTLTTVDSQHRVPVPGGAIDPGGENPPGRSGWG